MFFALQRFGVDFAGADPHGAFDIEDKNLAVADLAGMGGLGDRFDDLIRQVAGTTTSILILGRKLT